LRQTNILRVGRTDQMTARTQKLEKGTNKQDGEVANAIQSPQDNQSVASDHVVDQQS